ncbi:uncharacterized protein YukJ [Streptomyces sp. Ag109_G2-6]|uniref:DUF2278 family protein n=2 Tax=Streptomyces TaxID=1883 RepID=UPI000C2C0055|nr:DUF2278 family protein [Streptomyces sp. Ag109_G2-6]RPF30211.1 uncharacterized protein YukJ [Streptomyces sp. Ag109_G2-6]
MPLKKYGVLAARAVDRRREGSSDTPHYQIHLTDNAGTHYRAAVNVESQQAPSELLYLADDDFRHPVTELLPPAGSGWTALASQPGKASLDFIRGNLFDPASMRLLPPDLAGADNDLADLLDHYVQRAIADPTATLYLFGQRFGPEANIPDKVFGFRPGNGVHDIHMNQGNSGKFRSDNGIWQDGALLVHLPAENRWVAVFLAFQSQAWHTDDTTGHPIDTAPPRPRDREEPLRIMAALVNPTSSAPAAETVTLLNASPTPVNLQGWHLADRSQHTLPLPAGLLQPGTTLTITGGNGFHLDNQGGTITLLNPDGLKVHGVAYTARQAEREGQTITF